MVAGASRPFTRADFDRNSLPVLHRGRWANPDLLKFRQNGRIWVIKDFGARSWLVRNTIGRFMVRREMAALHRLDGVRGMPRLPFRLDAFALCYLFELGADLKHAETDWFSEEYFARLEALVCEMHARGIVHLDLRHGTNILITDDRAPVLIDFQSMLFLERVPRWLHGLLKDIDLSGVYKEWHRKLPGTLGEERMAAFRRMQRKRRLWILKGYSIFGVKKRKAEDGV